MTEWYYAQQGQQKGPVSEEQIRQLISSGTIQPTDLIWKQGMAQWTQARQIFPSPPSDSTSLPAHQVQVNGPFTKAQGMWSRLSTLQKALLAGGIAAVGVVLLSCMGMLFIGIRMEFRETAENFAEANALWDSGKKADAVDKYRVLLDTSYTYLSDASRPLVFRRVIEFDAEQGNADEAKNLIIKALDNNMALSLESPKAVALLTQVKDEKETKRKQSEEKRRLAKEAEQRDKDRNLSKDKNINGGKGSDESEAYMEGWKLGMLEATKIAKASQDVPHDSAVIAIRSGLQDMKNRLDSMDTNTPNYDKARGYYEGYKTTIGAMGYAR